MSSVEVEARGLVPGVELGPRIGRGGFATVYRARQTSVDRDVAVKIDSRPLDDDRNLRRFLREATAAARISGHPHVVSLYDCGMTRDDRPYLVMELCPNGSLASLIRRTGPLSPDDALDLGLAVCGALAAAHEAGILHRDVKPANILIDAYGTPRLSDFGLAAMPLDDQATSVTLEALTPEFAAPESFALQEPSRQSDVWSMGATLHAMIAAESPRRGSNGKPVALNQVIARLADPLPAPEAPGYQDLMEIVRTATAYEPADRFASGREMHDALRELREQRGASTTGGLVVGGPEATFVRLPEPPVPQAGPPSLPAPPVRRWPGLLVAAGLGALVGAGLTFGGTALTADRAGTPPPIVATPTSAGPSAAPASSPTSSPGPTSTPVVQNGPAVGQCLGGVLDAAGSLSARRLDCSDPHYWETFAVGRLAETTPDALESTVEDAPIVVATCTEGALRAYLDGAKGEFRIRVLPPTETQFSDGQRWFACIAIKDPSRERTGSLRDQ